MSDDQSEGPNAEGESIPRNVKKKKYKKTVKKPCPACDGTGDRRNQHGTRVKCRGCRGRGYQKEITIIEEVED